MTTFIRRMNSALLLLSGVAVAAFVASQPAQAQVAQPQAQEYHGRILSNGAIGGGNSWIASVDHPSTGVYIVHFKQDNGPGRVPNCVCAGENVEGCRGLSYFRALQVRYRLPRLQGVVRG